jgi:hypothetical protein
VDGGECSQSWHLFLRFATVLAANVQNGPDFGVVQKFWSAPIPCLNEFRLDAFPVTLLAGASQLHSGLIHFKSFFFRILVSSNLHGGPMRRRSSCERGCAGPRRTGKSLQIAVEGVTGTTEASSTPAPAFNRATGGGDG